jgi:outer membrane lipoprotein-sorting protein
MEHGTQMQESRSIAHARGKGARRPAFVRSLAVGAVIIAAALAWVFIGGGHGTVAFAKMSAALEKVQTVHITGTKIAMESGREGGHMDEWQGYTDKWIRREPFGMREDVTPADPNAPGAERCRWTVVSDAEKSYWYFPAHQTVTISRPFKVEFMDEITTLQGWKSLAGGEEQLKVERRDELNGKPVDIVSLPADPKVVLWVDPDRQLVLRAERFGKVGGREVKLMDLNFEYDVPVPPGTFEFTLPQGVRIIDKLHGR